MPHGHLSGAGPASRMPGGYSLRTIFLGRRKGEPRRINLPRTPANRARSRGYHRAFIGPRFTEGLLMGAAETLRVMLVEDHVAFR